MDAMADCHINSREHRPALNTDEAQSSLCDIASQEDALVASDARSLVGGLISVALEGRAITSLQARNCGVAFLATDPDICSILHHSVRCVRSLLLKTDLVSTYMFVWDGDKLTMPSLERRQRALHIAISDCLLGKFVAAAEDLEALDIDLQCHEISSPSVEAGDLVNFLGNHRWSQLQRLRLCGVWTSEDGLLDLLARHRGTLQYLEMCSVVLKEGTWDVFFQRLRALIRGSLLTRDTFKLSGCLVSRAPQCPGDQRWDLDASAERDGMGAILTEFIFGDGLHAVELLYDW